MSDGGDPPVRMTVPEMANVVHSLSPATPGMSITEVTALVQLFNNQLSAMEIRLSQKMDENSARATERWVKHDLELETNTKRVVARFEKLEGVLCTVEKALEAHLDREREEDIANDARIKPIRMSISWVWLYRKDILLFIIFVMAALAAGGEWFGRIIGPHAP